MLGRFEYQVTSKQSELKPGLQRCTPGKSQPNCVSLFILATCEMTYISIVPSVLEVSTVLDLLFSGQIKHLLAETELSVNFFLSQTKVCDIEEA
jgi:hypothetical protein